MNYMGQVRVGTTLYELHYLTGQVPVLLHHKALMYPTHIIMHKTCFISRIFFQHFLVHPLLSL